MLARLRIPSGWNIGFNTLAEPLEGSDFPELWDLKEDILQFQNHQRRVIVDLGWLPDFDPSGSYRLVTVALESDEDRQIEAWAAPLRIHTSKSYSEIVEVLEAWLEDESLAVSG